MRFFCSGEKRAKMVVSSILRLRQAVVRRSSWCPRRMPLTLTPTSSQIFWVTSSLSPVMILISMPRASSWSIAALTPVLAGSRKAVKPRSSSPASSYLEKVC